MAITLLRSAVYWHVFELSGSNAAVGTVGLVQFLPALALTLVGGAVADAYDRLRVMRLSQLPYLGSAALLFVATQGDAISVPLIYAAVFANAVAAAFDSPARQALLPSLVPTSAFPRAVTISSTAMALALASGPALAGGLIWAFGIEAAYGTYGLLVVANLVESNARTGFFGGIKRDKYSLHRFRLYARPIVPDFHNHPVVLI
jgi:MFS family permease